MHLVAGYRVSCWFSLSVLVASLSSGCPERIAMQGKTCLSFMYIVCPLVVSRRFPGEDLFVCPKCFVVFWDPDIRQPLILILLHSFTTSPLIYSHSIPYNISPSTFTSGCIYSYLNHHHPKFLLRQWRLIAMMYTKGVRWWFLNFCIHHSYQPPLTHKPVKAGCFCKWH